jgi:ubiquinone/menaquinone biosynthesis C-methylase UbiE
MTGWTCPLCKHDRAARFLGSEKLDSRFELVRCLKCGLLSIYPRPKLDELHSLYPHDYEPFLRTLDRSTDRIWQWIRRRHYAHRCFAVQRVCPPGGQILDVGCGTGGFLHELGRDTRWKAIGIDINPSALASARVPKVNALSAEAGRLCFPSDFFDVVTMWDVIEHVPDLYATLSEIRRVLKPRGSLLLHTPNSESWQAQLWRDHWQGWEIPRHLQVFSLHTIHLILHETGFKITQRISNSAERYYAVESLRNTLSAWTGQPLSSFEKIATSGLGVLGWPLFRLLDRHSIASTIGLEAQLIS